MLEAIFDAQLKDKPASQSVPKTPPKAATAQEKAKAEKLKQKGNTQMTAKKYDEAIESYTQAITLDGANAVYYSNRAAAYSSKGDHTTAIMDAEKAVELDPSFVKAYSRLG